MCFLVLKKSTTSPFLYDESFLLFEITLNPFLSRYGSQSVALHPAYGIPPACSASLVYLAQYPMDFAWAFAFSVLTALSASNPLHFVVPDEVLPLEPDFLLRYDDEQYLPVLSFDHPLEVDTTHTVVPFLTVPAILYLVRGRFGGSARWR